MKNKSSNIEVLSPVGLILCEEVIQGRDGSLSFFKVIDQLRPKSLPAGLSRFTVAVELKLNAPAKLVEKEHPCLKIVIVSPSGIEGEFAEITKLELEEGITARLIVETPGIRFKTHGCYVFRVYMKTKDFDYKNAFEKQLLVAEPLPESTQEQPETKIKKEQTPKSQQRKSVKVEKGRQKPLRKSK